MTSHSEAQSLIAEVQKHGATIYADAGKVRVQGVSKLPTTLVEKIKERRDDVLAVLTVPRLPWQLERLLAAASSHTLTFTMSGIPDVNRYVQAWACEYLVNDKEQALKRLWHVWNWSKTLDKSSLG
jgi:hypothetical protein